jgi:hypothetical protein
MWNRVEDHRRILLNLIYVFKTGHLDAVGEGRALIRPDGKIFPAQFTKVEDAELQDKLKLRVEEMFDQMSGEIGPAPIEEPIDMRFFRIDARA